MRRTKWFRLAVAIAIAFSGLVVWGLAPATEVQVTTAAVTAGPIVRRVVATGTVQAETTVEVGAEISGVVQSLAADYNSLVHAGQVVARLDPATYVAQLRVAEAAHAQTQAALLRAQAEVLDFRTEVEDAQTKLTRAEELAARQIIPPSDLEAARLALDEAHADLGGGEADVAQSEAAIVQAEAALEQAEINVEHTLIRSPIDGIVIDRDVDVGQTLAASVQSPVLFRIASDLTRLQVQVGIDESDVGGLTPGEPVSFDVESYPDETFHGTLSQVRLQPIATAPTAPATLSTATASQPGAAAVVSYQAIVHVANPDQRLRPGMTAVAVLNGLRREHTIRIPNGALAFRPPAEVLHALGEVEPRLPKSPTEANEGEPTTSEVWEFDGQQFTPIGVRAGLADNGWSELLSGSIRPGDALVTSAALHRRFARVGPGRK
jgi:HlyD family secretion protein